jgi:hypothetical protein
MWLRDLLHDFVEVRALVVISGLCIITYLVLHHVIGDGAFSTCFVTLIGCYTAHSCLDDKLPDRNQDDARDPH